MVSTPLFMSWKAVSVVLSVTVSMDTEASITRAGERLLVMNLFFSPSVVPSGGTGMSQPLF